MNTSKHLRAYRPTLPSAESLEIARLRAENDKLKEVIKAILLWAESLNHSQQPPLLWSPFGIWADARAVLEKGGSL